jgi:hypothetical protein
MVHDAKSSLVNHPHTHLDLKQLGRKLADRSRESTTMFLATNDRASRFCRTGFRFRFAFANHRGFLCFLEFGTWWLSRFESREF